MFSYRTSCNGCQCLRAFRRFLSYLYLELVAISVSEVSSDAINKLYLFTCFSDERLGRFRCRNFATKSSICRAVKIMAANARLFARRFLSISMFSENIKQILKKQLFLFYALNV